jgi:NADH:ubiquinone oxidoreductase subunit F (NADH-binding)
MTGGSLALDVWPGLRPRLLGPGWDEREDLDMYARQGGYLPGLRGEPLIAALRDSGLRGRGGAGFPAWRKWLTVWSGARPRYVIANGAEGEPASIKDRYLLRHRPHLVLDGLLRAIDTLVAERGFVYLTDGAAATSVHRALSELGPAGTAIELVQAPDSYVAGDETAAVRAVGGEAALPAQRPPRPFEAGVHGCPTLVTNVETLANVTAVATERAVDDRRLVTVTGDCRRPGLFEVPVGTSLARVVSTLAGGSCDQDPAFLAGGFFGGIHPSESLATKLEDDAFRAAGGGLGCGAIVLLGIEDCPVGVAADVMAYFAAHNARQCGACINGTAAMRDALLELADGQARPELIERLVRWSTTLRGRGACATLDGASLLAASLLSGFEHEITRHLAEPCIRCRRRPPDADGSARRFTAPIDSEVCGYALAI